MSSAASRHMALCRAYCKVSLISFLFLVQASLLNGLGLTNQLMTTLTCPLL